MDLTGKSLGHYAIKRFVGRSAIGTVYQASDLTIAREVFIQVIDPKVASQPAFRERFPHEMNTLSQIEHPSLIKVLDFGQDKTQLYVATEYVPGATLRQLLDELIRQREWISLGDTLHLVEQLCQAVDYAHKRGLFGWDLKPSSIMFKMEANGESSLRAVLTDLHLSSLVDALEIASDESSLGSATYMSPEQALGKTPDARSSVYSLGVLLYELLVGIPPFPIRTLKEALLYHANEVTPAPRSIRPDLSDSLEQVILNALEIDPQRRYASVLELETALSDAMKDTTEVAEVEAGRDGKLLQKYRESLGVPPIQASSLVNQFEPGETELQPAFDPSPPEEAPKRSICIELLISGKRPQEFTFQGEMVDIGRGRENDLVIEDPKISRRHAKVTRDGSNYYVEDLNSANGSYLDTIHLQSGIPTIWRPHQVLHVGGASLRLTGVEDTGTVVDSYDVGSLTSMEKENIAGEPLVVSVTPYQLTVDPGESVTATISVLNQTSNRDSFSLALSGIPTEWVSSLPSHVQLMPGEQKVTAFTLTVPRNPQNRAGRHPFTLIVASQLEPSRFVEIRMTLTVAAFSQFRAELQPQVLHAGQNGRVTVYNLGNFQDTFTIQLTDPTGELLFHPPQVQVRIPEGRSVYLDFQAQERQLRVFGNEKSFLFGAQVSLPNGEAQTLRSELLSRGFLPIWVLPAVFLLCLLFAGSASALYLYLHRTTTLTVSSNGMGTVISDPPGINCGATCSFHFANNTSVKLTASAAPSSTFSGWTGAGCSGTGECIIKMNADQTVNAAFNTPGTQTLNIYRTGQGNGTISSDPPGIVNCAELTCSYTLPENSTVILRATAISSSTFGGWSGEGCSGTGNCIVTMSALRTVIATFNPPGKKTLSVTIASPGTGTVTSDPQGINCGSICSFDFSDNTPVTLKPSPASGYTFGNWSGACNGTGACIVTMNTVQAVTATFNLVNNPPPATFLTGQPPKLSNSKTATFNFSGTGTAITFECELDTDNFAPCPNPKIYSDLTDGPHTFQVQAKDSAGVTDPSPEKYDWTVDTIGPSIIEIGKPRWTGFSTMIQFTVTFNDIVMSFDKNRIQIKTAGGTLLASSISPNAPASFYTVQVDIGTNNRVDISILAGAATDAAGNPSQASAPVSYP